MRRTSLAAAFVACLSMTLGALPLRAEQSGEMGEYAVPCSQRQAAVLMSSPGKETEVVRALEVGFGAGRFWGEENFEVPPGLTFEGKRILRVVYPEGTSSPSDTRESGERGGGGFYTAPDILGGSEHACLRYRVRFPDTFDFVKGGKLPGIYGGEAPSGGHQAAGDNGFSMRLMWREGGQGELYAYVVKPQSDSGYGASLGRGSWHFSRGEWMALEMELVLNTPGLADGAVRLWVNDEPVFEREGVIYRDTPRVTIDGLMFSTFFGGTGADWRTPFRQQVDFADFRFYRPAS